MSTVTRLPARCCRRHPDMPWPHGTCDGPSAPLSRRDELLAEAIRDLRIAAAFGDPDAARWLDRRGIAHLPGDDT